MDRLFAIGVFLCATLLQSFSPLPARAQEILLATGADRVYHETGRALCRLVTRQVEDIRCTALQTESADFNLSNVSGGALEMAIVPADLHYHAVKGSGPFAFTDIPYDTLRSLFSLQVEAFTVMARRDSGIQAFVELEGHRVNIGNPRSRQRALMELAMNAMGWVKGDFQLVDELPLAQQSLALCHNRVQAIPYVVAHPNETVAQTLGLCEGRLLAIRHPEIDKAIAQAPYFVPVTIPGGLYEGSSAVSTFGLRATLVSSSDVSAELVEKIVTAVFENLDRLRTIHPVLARLQPERMVREGLTAPLHEGALRYYRSRGWM
ncbi:MAG: TAXI family TRAP transporter solute-binding subunit [Gammaproteobacteria bacterium]|nr:TAXI family TRAP transporter solute-binding subunit [Gammaproteobacteria bacterium]NIR81873.1 TAXI family TRAP transporter solute-binding subunit [Gammaproteobacteria bacterium]NIR88705.1 TAXI family TRAP transporter solute-binding subunit [Gammaproteobacteria bacterium]NIU02981.1 TAXI family TRAP transporter solute-binding subunit [Gammaproteobacteria bacterium]NIV50502.1 TAXI family TRAP transporter solute-binding subunit [Gammaproteobacteria bacterium]